jgi:hypothetical protein
MSSMTPVEDEIARKVERQLRLVALAVPHWRSAVAS